MNKEVGNRDKKIAMLLIAAFAWLFIGSLIVFHQEHVLGKHYRLNSQMFITPKTKDKKDYNLILQKSILKVTENGPSAGILPNTDIAGLLSISFEFQSKEFASFHLNDALITQIPLRGPPVYSN